MSAYFFSDLHLRRADEPKTLQLDHFLSRLLEQRRAGGSSTPTQVFFVGDIFDFWIGSHRYFREKFHATIEAVRALVAAGVEVHYFEGNHDLHLRGFWERELGVTVHAEPAQFLLAGYRVRVEHGDQMNPEDRGYLFLRWLLRTPPVAWLALNLPAQIVSAIGEWASGLSRRHPGARPAELIREMVRRHARKTHVHEKFDYLIAGHVHVVVDAALDGGGRVVNLGCWDDGAKVYRLDEQGGAFLSEL